MNCVRFTETLGIPPDSSATVFPVLKDLLGVLEEPGEVQHILPVLFRLRLASDLGYAPAFSACSACGRQSLDTARFLFSEGTLLCPSCASASSGIDLSRGALAALRQVQTESPLNWDFIRNSGEGTSLLPAERRACVRAVDSFVQYHLGVVWENGRFRRV